MNNLLGKLVTASVYWSIGPSLCTGVRQGWLISINPHKMILSDGRECCVLGNKVTPVLHKFDSEVPEYLPQHIKYIIQLRSELEVERKLKEDAEYYLDEINSTLGELVELQEKVYELQTKLDSNEPLEILLGHGDKLIGHIKHNGLHGVGIAQSDNTHYDIGYQICESEVNREADIVHILTDNPHSLAILIEACTEAQKALFKESSTKSSE